MDRNKILIVLLAVSVASFAALSLITDKDDTSGSIDNVENNRSEKIKTTEDGTKYIVNPSKLRQGCPSMECIPSIDDPSYESVEEAGWMEPDDEIISVEINGSARAYPLKIMDSHEIVNTKVGGDPVAVTYCPLCRSGVTFSRRIQNEVLEFGVSGKLRNANLVMYDRQSETYWSQIGGEAIIGPRTGQSLDIIYSSIGNWSSWKDENPEGEVLSRNTGIYPASSYSSREYLERGYDDPSIYGAEISDDRLDETELVHGVKIENASKAYPNNIVREKKLIQDSIQDEPVMMLEKKDGTIIGFSRKLEGETLNFTRDDDVITSSDGKRFDLDGNQLDGNQSLEVIVPKGFYWFAWAKFNPDTEVYKE